MYKPGQLITIEGEVYRIYKGVYACFYCYQLNDKMSPSYRLKYCPYICKKKIPKGMFPLHISRGITKDGRPYIK